MSVWFEVRSARAPYSVESERNVFAVRAAEMRRGVVLADRYFAEQLASAGIHAIGLEASEASKSLDAMSEVVMRMRAAGATRESRLWAVGGGAVQDVAGFVASIYMRGIAWTYVPTTLLGMVDSCIGGKSSINVKDFKNLVGTFHTPDAVLIDPTLTATLSTEQRVAGLNEAAKICYCRGEEAFAEHLSLRPSPANGPDAFEPVIARSLRAKQWFVEIDEFDRAQRRVLNFGHTFGHGLESASGYRLSHGVAVGVGILCAASLSRSLLGAPPGGAAPLLERHVRRLLDAWPEVREIVGEIEPALVFEHMQADKKHSIEHYRFITLDAEGRPQVTELAKTDAVRTAVIAAIRAAAKSLAP
jgi:3-dehydroquinate synthase